MRVLPLSLLVTLVMVPAASLSAVLSAQGTGSYLNFETPQVKPIAHARVGDRDFLLCCNTPDSSLEVRDVVALKLLARIPVGLEPVSVVFDAKRSVAYTCNMVGDSVSRISLRLERGALRARLERTMWVGDEPMCLAIAPDGHSLFVSLNSAHALAWIRSDDLLPAAPGILEHLALPDRLKQATQNLRNPRAMMFRGSVLYVLGFRSGHSYLHDIDLWSLDLRTGTLRALGGLGTMNANMAFDSAGRLFVVGGDAQNGLSGESRVRQSPTGFLTSLLHRIDAPSSARPTVRTRDLNEDSNGKPVAFSASLAHPMDVVLVEGPSLKRKVFLAAMHRDAVGVIEAESSNPRSWLRRRIAMRTAPGSGNTMAGPRGLCFKPANPKDPRDPGPRVYVLQRLDNSVAEIDPRTEKLLRVVPLAHDPTPRYIREGRSFLYGAQFSGNGFVSCASCHLDGRTDGLGWDLGAAPASPQKPIPQDRIDGVTGQGILGRKLFVRAKGTMVTQSMQGIVNSEVNREAQLFFSNLPYHWRGDQASLHGFNAAFVGLQGMKNVAGPGQPARGISVQDMNRFEDFANSISLPPNPLEPVTRTYSGNFGTANAEDGSGAQLGLKLFHTHELLDPKTKTPEPGAAGRSCVECHQLPEGSNNRLTRMGLSTKLPIESALLRGIRQRSSMPVPLYPDLPRSRVGEFGLEHQGTLRSIQDFNASVFGHYFAKNELHKLAALTQYVQEFDSGVAPIVGFAWTFVGREATSAFAKQALTLAEGQAVAANAGLILLLAEPSALHGFRFDPITRLYVEEGGQRRLSRAQVQSLASKRGNRFVLQCTPLGSERRLASRTGQARIEHGPAPSKITLEALLPMTAYRRVPELTKNWVPGPRSKVDAFHWSGVYSGTLRPVREPASLRMLRTFQYGLIQDGPSLGLRALRHEAPRRFRVAGRDFRHGCKLVLFVPMDPKQAPPYLNLARTLPIVVPLHPSGMRSKDGRPVWESSALIEPELLYTLMLGGPMAPGVEAARLGKLAEPPAKGSFQPLKWNRHAVYVVNPDGSYGNGFWQSLHF